MPVSFDQSPWRHTFGYTSKYAARYLDPSGSFQNVVGMLGKGSVQTSSPASPVDGDTVLVEHLDLHPEPARLELAAPDWSERIAQREARDDVRAAADAAQPHIALHVAVDVVEAVRRERTSRRQDRSRAIRGRASSPASAPDFSGEGEPLRARPEHRQALLAARSHSTVAVAEGIGAPSYSTTVAPTARPRHEPVPHHPPAGREVEDAVVAPEVAVEHDAP